MGSELTIDGKQDGFSQQQLAALGQMGVRNASQGDLAVFFHQVQRTGLDPFARQIYMIERKGKQTIQTGIDGFRLIARRASEHSRETFGEPETLWCGMDGVWRDVWLDPKVPPAAAKVVVQRGQGSFTGVATYREYAGHKSDGGVNSMWASKPAIMLAKCFDDETEVLTRDGFYKFSEAHSPIMQVTDSGLQETDAVPFKQDYEGPMVSEHGDMLDFSVTPNHDMMTTVGKVEARAMLATSSTRPIWRIPMCVGETAGYELPVDDESLRIAAAVIADGSYNTGSFKVAVSRPDKIAALDGMNADTRYIRHTKGNIAHTEIRDIQSNFDKVVFGFKPDRLFGLLDETKTINNHLISELSYRQARVLLDTWIDFDGHRDRKSGVRRLYTSRPDHLRSAELLAVEAGYSVSKPKSRGSDISTRPNWYLTVSESKPLGVVLKTDARPGIAQEPTNDSGEVWCVNVPSHVIVVRRHGFSMLCGNCAEALALRKAFPQDLSGLYTADELDSPDVIDVQELQPAQRADAVAPSPSKEDCEHIVSMMQQGGVHDAASAALAFKALVGREITNPVQLTIVEAEQLLSAPELVVSRTKAALEATNA